MERRDAQGRPIRRSKKGRRVFFLAIFIALIGLLPVAYFLYPEWQSSQLLKNGIPAEGVILKIKDTGNRYNDQPQVKIWLEVKPDGLPKYEAVTKMIISPVYLPQFQPGKRVKVRYDPEDMSKVAIESSF